MKPVLNLESGTAPGGGGAGRKTQRCLVTYGMSLSKEPELRLQARRQEDFDCMQRIKCR